MGFYLNCGFQDKTIQNKGPLPVKRLQEEMLKCCFNQINHDLAQRGWATIYPVGLTEDTFRELIREYTAEGYKVYERLGYRVLEQWQEFEISLRCTRENVKIVTGDEPEPLLETEFRGKKNVQEAKLCK